MTKTNWILIAMTLAVAASVVFYMTRTVETPEEVTEEVVEEIVEEEVVEEVVEEE